MRRTPRVAVAWVAAAVVALVTVRVVASDLAALHRRARELGPPRPVVVAARDLPLGAMLGARDLGTVSREASTAPPGALGDVRDAVGRVVAVPMLRDDVVTSRHLTPRDRSGLDGVVPPGGRAVHVIVKDGFRPSPGSVVDVLAAFDATSVTVEGAADSAVIVASAARVLAVDTSRSDDAAASGVTLLVTEAEAPAVAFAAANAQLSLALAPPETACCSPSSR